MPREEIRIAEKMFHPGLEGLRGVSVLAVLVFHARPEWLPGGFLGVSTFFTLSGFLITGLLIGEWRRSERLDLVAFWGRRLRRLLPASLVALFAIAGVGAWRADPVVLDRLWADGLSALFYVSNWWLIQSGAEYDNLMGTPSWIQHFWSLSIEEQYYFAYPIIAFAVFRASAGSTRVFAALLTLATLASFGAMYWMSTGDASTARLYYGTDTRAGELLAGGVLAIVLAGRSFSPPLRLLVRNLGVVGVAFTAVGWAIGDVDSNGLYRGGLALYTAGSLAIIAAAVQPGGLVRGLLSLTTLRWLGRISYGVYVYHWPLFLWFDSMPVRIVSTLLLAEISYRFLEEPIRTRRRIVGSQRLIAVPLTLGVATAAFVYVMPAAEDAASISRFASAQAAQEPELRIAVVGGSVARDVAEALTRWAEWNENASVLSFASPGCGIARGAWGARISRRSLACDKWPKRVREEIPAFDPTVVVVSSVAWDFHPRRVPAWGEEKIIGDPIFDEWLIGQYVEAVDLFDELGVPVVWLNTPCYISPAGFKTGTWDPARLRRLNDHVLPELARRRPSKVSLIDFETKVCPGGEYTNSLFGIDPFRPDGTHFSNVGKTWLGEWLGGELHALRKAGALELGAAPFPSPNDSVSSASPNPPRPE